MEVEPKHVARRVIVMMIMLVACFYVGYKLGRVIGYQQGKEDIMKYMKDKLIGALLDLTFLYAAAEPYYGKCGQPSIYWVKVSKQSGLPLIYRIEN